MPEIVRFYGIIIKMFFKPKEHEPSHIHAIYNEYVGLFNIKTFDFHHYDTKNKKTICSRQLYPLCRIR